MEDEQGAAAGVRGVLQGAFCRREKESMTRKRFMKLVMSYGVAREEAKRLAGTVRFFGSYQYAFDVCSTYLALRQSVRIGLNAFAKCVEGGFEWIEKSFSG